MYRTDCIKDGNFIDPPYNTGNEKWVYNDNVNDPRIRRWLGEIVGPEGEDLSRHDKWLCMMYPRLKLLQRLLSDDGVFFISIGDDELANLLYIVREIFGRINAVFVWKSRTKPTNAGKAKYRPQKVTEYILMFTQDENRIFNIAEKEDNYSYPNNDEFGRFRTTTILTSNYGTYQRETMRFSIAGYTPPSNKRWKAGPETIQALYDNHRLHFTEDGYPMKKIYDYDSDKITSPLYTFISSEISGTAESGKNELNKILGMGHGFDTVKPVSLIEYLISISTNPGDLILDSFAGTGTTAHAVLNLNKNDGGNRKFILIEMMDYAENITAERMRRVISGYGEGKKSVEGTGGGFGFYELGAPLLNGENLNEDAGTEKIREYVWYTETRTRIPPSNPEEPYLLGVHAGTAVYFYYENGGVTTLDRDFLRKIRTKAEKFLIYADVCTLGKSELEARKIRFKKIPRDISKI